MSPLVVILDALLWKAASCLQRADLERAIPSALIPGLWKLLEVSYFVTDSEYLMIPY